MADFLVGKRCIITGASSGIGRSIAKILVNEYSCTVIGVARREEKLRELADELGGRFDYIVGDVTEDCWLDSAQSILTDAPRDTVLFSVAGILPKFRSFEKSDASENGRVLDTNFNAVTRSVARLLPFLGKGGGIVIVSSSAALAPLIGTAVYSSSKAAISAFGEALREEMRGRLYVGMMYPGFTKTPLFDVQNISGKSSMVLKIASDCDRVAGRIVKRCNKRKSRTVIGLDAHFMDIFYRIAPRVSLRFLKTVITKSSLEIFEDVK